MFVLSEVLMLSEVMATYKQGQHSTADLNRARRLNQSLFLSLVKRGMNSVEATESIMRLIMVKRSGQRLAVLVVDYE